MRHRSAILPAHACRIGSDDARSGRSADNPGRNDQDERLLIDTGAFLSLISPATVSQLGLKPSGEFAVVSMAQGTVSLPKVVLDGFSVADLGRAQTTFYMAPQGVLPLSDAGSFGNDFLQAWDADFDFGARRFNLISPGHCKGQVVYWTHDAYAATPFRLNSDKHVQISVRLDGRRLRGIIDTGTSVTTMMMSRAQRMFRVKDDPKLQALPAPAEIRWRNPPSTAYIYPFKTLSIEGIEANNPVVMLRTDIDTGDEQIVIGMSMLKKLHLYIAYKEGMLYITPSGAQ
jgi:predicted aspartyl protease